MICKVSADVLKPGDGCAFDPILTSCFTEFSNYVPFLCDCVLMHLNFSSVVRFYFARVFRVHSVYLLAV